MTKIQQHAKWLGLLGWAFIFLVLALAFSGCATHKQHGPPPPEAERISRADTTGRPPVGVVVQPAEAGPQKGFLGALFGKKSAPTAANGLISPGPQTLPRKCKGCVFNTVAGDQQNNTAAKNATAGTGATGGGKAAGPVAGTGGTATHIEKAKAPVSTGAGDATDQSGTGAASAIKGDGNAPVLTNAPVEAPDWKAQLAAGFATPVGKALGLVVFACFGYGVYRLWPLLRRKSSNSNQA